MADVCWGAASMAIVLGLATLFYDEVQNMLGQRPAGGMV